MKNYLRELKVIRTTLNTLNAKVDAMIYEIELPTILEKVAMYKKRKIANKVTTAWLQKEFQIGYAHASRLLDEIKAQ